MGIIIMEKTGDPIIIKPIYGKSCCEINESKTSFLERKKKDSQCDLFGKEILLLSQRARTVAECLVAAGGGFLATKRSFSFRKFIT